MLNVHFCCQSFRNEDILLPFRFCTIHIQRNKEKTVSSGRQEINGEAFKVAGHTAVLYIMEHPSGTPVLILRQVALLPRCFGKNQSSPLLGLQKVSKESQYETERHSFS